MKKQYGLAYLTVIFLIVIYGVIMGETVKNFQKAECSAITEENLKQNLGFHDKLFQLKSRTDLIIGEKMIQGVYITKERLLEKQFSETGGNAEKLNQFYEKYHIPVYLVLVPSATAIYESNLPANALNVNQEELIKSVYAGTGTGIRCIDAYAVLRSLKENYIYYRTDSHWTSYGAYHVYQSAIQKMGFTPVSYQKYVISHLSTEFRGNLYQKTLYDAVKPDVLDCYTNETGSKITEILAYDGEKVEKREELHDTEALKTENMYEFYLGKPCEKLIIRTDLDNDKKLLLYQDSYGDCMLPFLLQHYHEICVVNLEKMNCSEIHPEEYTQVMVLSSISTWQKVFS